MTVYSPRLMHYVHFPIFSSLDKKKEKNNGNLGSETDNHIHRHTQNV